MRLLFTYLLILLFEGTLNAQPGIDSLAIKYRNSKTPKERMVVLADLAYSYMYTNPDTSLVLVSKAIKIGEKLKLLPEVAQYEYEKALYFHVKSDFKSALSEYDISIYHCKKLARSKNKNHALKGRKGIAKAINNKGNIYFESGNYPEALKCFYEALSKNEAIGDEMGQADNLKGIANVYLAQDRFKDAVEKLEKALEKARKTKYIQLEGTLLGTMGTAFNLQKDYANGLYYLQQSYDIAVKTNDLYSQAIAVGNMASSYNGKKEYERSQECYSKALKLYRMMGQYTNVAITYMNLGQAEIRKNNIKKAEQYFLRSVAISDSTDSKDVKLNGLKYLYTLYDSTKQYATALAYYKKYIDLRNVLNSDENTRRQIEIELNYSYAQKKAADSTHDAITKRRLDLERRDHLRNQRVYLYAGLGGILVMLIVSIVSLRAFREKKKANRTIEMQKLLVEEKQKELLDSIHYAKRIQNALLPSEKTIIGKIKKLQKK